MKAFETYLQLINSKIDQLQLDKTPKELYEPIAYSLKIGGKRLRPLLTILSCEMFGGQVIKALPAAVAIEIFHNFTLVHDDIMDVAPMRRGKETVYKKWNTNIGILSGDAMLAKAFELLTELETKHVKPVVKLLSDVAILVCEGQQLDMNYEHMENISISRYLSMIKLKTAALVAASLKAGALIAEAPANDCKEIFKFGESLGMAFQLQDDILDVFGDEEKFGKKSGGDIIARKKTYLYLKANEVARGKIKKELQYYYSKSDIDNKVKIAAVSEIYYQLGIMKYAEKEMNNYFKQAKLHLDNIKLPEKNKKKLSALAAKLMVREF
ncbi:MAG: polyprenyl synthetase family protein [Bacteroidales bacterium]|jgi:geranylgeranyl diphosphate synthase type II|nr:polyprenyl synthetase family protein [Bacteroidales bacterium]MDD4215394.1 polyprenyl synthetase family protein [Bacteroidales bacterium]